MVIQTDFYPVCLFCKIDLVLHLCYDSFMFFCQHQTYQTCLIKVMELVNHFIILVLLISLVELYFPSKVSMIVIKLVDCNLFNLLNHHCHWSHHHRIINIKLLSSNHHGHQIKLISSSKNMIIMMNEVVSKIYNKYGQNIQFTVFTESSECSTLTNGKEKQWVKQYQKQ